MTVGNRYLFVAKWLFAWGCLSILIAWHLVSTRVIQRVQNGSYDAFYGFPWKSHSVISTTFYSVQKSHKEQPALRAKRIKLHFLKGIVSKHFMCFAHILCGHILKLSNPLSVYVIISYLWFYLVLCHSLVINIIRNHKYIN